MKILLFTDLHMCARASIINKWGIKYPIRLENCLDSINWVEDTAKKFNCDCVINLGDFFDKPELSSEVITLCKEIKWASIKHYSLVGNHEATTSSLDFNSTNYFLNAEHQIIVKPTKILLAGCELCFLPYILEADRKDISSYFGKKSENKRIIFSHNDINGIQLGPIMSKTGFTVQEIEKNCDLFINGHLHNGQKITDKIINLGNLTGKDFGEDAAKYAHNVLILDTNTFDLQFIENPYALNFYKLSITDKKDFSFLKNLKNNAVLSIKCDSNLVNALRKSLDTYQSSIQNYRLIILNKQKRLNESEELSLAVDHLARFVECCKLNIENTQLLEEELAEVCK